jgi:hypothetical protein
VTGEFAASAVDILAAQNCGRLVGTTVAVAIAIGTIADLSHRHGNLLCQIVPHALEVPWLLCGLDVAVGVGRAAGQLVIAWARVPFQRPTAPGKRAEGRFMQYSVCPLAVDADFNW